MTALLKPLLRRIDFGTPLKDTASLSLDFARQEYYAEGLGTSFGGIVTFTRASSATYFDSSGVLQTASTNAPRFDYDPVTLQPRGLLIEEARTNLLSYSSGLTNAAWNKENGTWAYSADSKFASIGTFTENTATGKSRVTGRTISLTAGTTYTHTELLKASGRNIIRLQIFLANNTVSADFNLTTGAVSNIQGGTASITPLGDGWYACAVVLGVTTTQGYVVRFYPIVAGNPSYTGDGREAFKHAGAQLEAGAFPTSYIPTVASQATRSADVASVNTLSPWYNASEGTIVASFAEGLGFYPPVFTLDDGTGNNRFYIYRNAASATQSTRLSADGSAAGVSIFNSLGPIETGDGTLAFAYANNSFALVFKGGAVATDNSGAVPTNTTLSIGNNTPTGRKLNGHIHTIRYFKTKHANFMLEGETR